MGEIPLDVRGKRPAFFDDPATDAMMTALLEVMAENWALKERLYALEKVLVDGGALKKGALEGVEWSDAERAVHEAERRRILEDALRAVKGNFQSASARRKSIDA